MPSLDSCGDTWKCSGVDVEKALTGRASVHLFYHGRVQINNPYGVSFPVHTVLFISKS